MDEDESRLRRLWRAVGGRAVSLAVGLLLLAVLTQGGAFARVATIVLIGLLVLMVIPVAGFTFNQYALTRKGRDIATTVEEVRSLKQSDAEAFRGVLAPARPARPAAVTGEVVAFRPETGPAPVREVGGGARVDAGAREHSAPLTFWQALTAEERATFTALAQERSYQVGTVLCRQGQAADRLMVICSGWTKVCVNRPGGERILAVRVPGDLVGERAAFLVRSRSASVTALDHVTALVIEAADFDAFLAAHPRVHGVLESQMYDRLTEDGPLTEAGDRSDVPGRLAALVVGLVLRHRAATGALPEFGAPLSAHTLASWADVPKAVAGRILSEWRAGGLITTSRNRVKVTDLERLRSLFERTAVRPYLSPQEDPGELDREWSGLNCSIVLTDIAGFGQTFRDDEDRLTLRRVMYAALEDSFEAAGIDWEQIYREDRGDGALLVVPPTTSTKAVAVPLLTSLAERLAQHNSKSPEGTKMQLRAALHVGPVLADPQGVSGEAIIHTARLLEASPLKERMAGNPADVGFITSTHVYDTVLKHGRAWSFEQIGFHSKEAELHAWMRLSA